MHDLNDILLRPDLQDVIERFEAKFERRGPDECWEWQASRMPKGYGRFGTVRGISSMNLAHRVSYVLYNGKLPVIEGWHGACVLHRCDNPPCVNPAHLFVGSIKDNIHDMIDKNRQSINYPVEGKPFCNARLTVEQVISIRADPRNCCQIGRELGISSTHVGYIKKRKVWKQIP